VRFLGQTGTVATTGARTTEWLGIGKAGSLRADPESRLFIARTGEVIGFPRPKLDRPDRRTPYCRADAPAPIVIPKNRNSVPAHPPYGSPGTHHNPLSFRGTRNPPAEPVLAWPTYRLRRGRFHSPVGSSEGQVSWPKRGNGLPRVRLNTYPSEPVGRGKGMGPRTSE
jgi:hypothetical protein